MRSSRGIKKFEANQQSSSMAQSRDHKYPNSIATKLLLSYLPIIIISSSVFTVVGIKLISTRIINEAQEKVKHDLNSARVIYQSALNHISDVVRLTANQVKLSEAIISKDFNSISPDLQKTMLTEGLDILSITDAQGKVLFRTANPNLYEFPFQYDEIVSSVLSQQTPVVASSVVSADELARESEDLRNSANIEIIDTPKARLTDEKEVTSGLVIKAAAPIINIDHQLVGVIYGGKLLNQNFDIVDEIKQTVFEGLKYLGKDVGTATIFLDDVRISTNVRNSDGTRAIGTRLSEEVYNKVVLNGENWIGRAFVVNDWYITAYEPIRNIHYQTIGVLYVGILEQRYTDLKNQTIGVFLLIALAGVALSLIISYLTSQRITGPIKKLATASREIASGNFNPKLIINSGDELGELSLAFTTMTHQLAEREDKLKEFTKSKIMESDRLAIIGQLAANVAHELNNPLVGIITYSQLLLEDTPTTDNSVEFLNKIVIQANRCKEIVRGLLDFSRQKKTDKILLNINTVISQCISLLENQAIFHNIKISLNLMDLPMVIIDQSQIERVFMNIILNAAEAMEGKGTLDIISSLDSNDGYVVVEIKDSGPGISEENLEQLFDPFFTTKEAGHGVGLGLAISYGIVREHNGTISVKTKLGVGTSFVIKLPVSIHGNNRY